MSLPYRDEFGTVIKDENLNSDDEDFGGFRLIQLFHVWWVVVFAPSYCTKTSHVTVQLQQTIHDENNHRYQIRCLLQTIHQLSHRGLQLLLSATHIQLQRSSLTLTSQLNPEKNYCNYKMVGMVHNE